MMVLLAFFLFFICILILVLFAFPQFSPIPYFPSNGKDIDKIIRSLRLKNRCVFIDLGAGDGTVIFNAATFAYRKKLNTQIVATDINPILLLILHVRRFFHPNKKNIRIMRADMFSMDFSSLYSQRSKLHTVIYLYISPWYLEPVIRNLKLTIKNFSLVSYMYPVKSLKSKEKIIRGSQHDIFTYTIE